MSMYSVQLKLHVKGTNRSNLTLQLFLPESVIDHRRNVQVIGFFSSVM